MTGEYQSIIFFFRISCRINDYAETGDDIMLAVPGDLQLMFDEYLRKNNLPAQIHGEYRKWLRYDLDFCSKKHASSDHEKSLAPFVRKLQDKK